MASIIRKCTVLALTAVLSGCVAINGVSNTSLVRPLPSEPTFQLVSAGNTDPAVSRKVGQMIAYQLLRRGFRNPPKDGEAELKALYSFDVVPAGSTSTAFTTIHQPRQSYVSGGGVVTSRASIATATTVVDTDPTYQKTIAVRIVDAKTGSTYWEGQVSETGSCNRIFVTAPNILALLFDKFPREVSNASRRIEENDPAVKELRGLFPHTNWGCR
jgi:hypothetical protein